MEICIRRAHAHPLGVLWYSMAESVVLFGNLEDVNCAHRTLPDVTELHNEAIMVRTMALTEAHVATFTAMWHSNPTSEDGESHTPPHQSPPSEETPCCLHAQLGDLNDSELCQLIKDLSQEITQSRLTVPPSNPPPHDWVCPLGSREPEEDDQEVTFPGGVQRDKPPQFYIHQLGEEFPLDHHNNHHVLHWQDQIWGNSSLP